MYLDKGIAAEAVDVDTDGTYAYLCGGFGVRINKVTNPAALLFHGQALSRCQRIGIGPSLLDGSRAIYLAHHGDSWVPGPFLRSFRMSPTGLFTQVDSIDDPALLFEGLHYYDGNLYAATHASGLRIYGIDLATGVPSAPIGLLEDGLD